MLYFYAYPTRHNDGIIVSSIPIKKGESWKIKTKKRINRKSTEPEYQTFLHLARN